MTLSKAATLTLSVLILLRCVRSLLHERYEPEIWGYLKVSGEALPIFHWENLIGRSRSADLRLRLEKVSPVHAVLSRSDRGQWTLYDVFSRGGVWVNGAPVASGGCLLRDGDALNFAGHSARFCELPQEDRDRLEEKRRPAGGVSPTRTLLQLSFFQLFLFTEHCVSAKSEYLGMIALAYVSLLVLEWSIFNAMRVMGRRGFEVETLAFYLTTIGTAVAASSTPGEMDKQVYLILAAVLLFVLGGWWMRSLRRTLWLRIPTVMGAIALLLVNILASRVVLGARNWLEFGGFSFQPSEFVKAAYVYAGASTLDLLYRRRNLYSFILFSGFCVVSLALIGDFGTALVFFVAFLVISFLRSGSIATVLLAVSAAGLAGFLAVNIRPYIAERFTTWGHAWEDMYNGGYQQTRAMSAAAAGGLFGKGAGAGWLKEIFAANTDMVFAMVCEELGLLIALCMVAALLLLAFFAIRSTASCRSAYYAIAACAAVSILLTQVALNVFGSLDLLPFTGVTFPFVSRGGSSLLSCWMLMAFLKSADNRREASFAVRPGARVSTDEDEEDA